MVDHVTIYKRALEHRVGWGLPGRSFGHDHWGSPDATDPGRPVSGCASAGPHLGPGGRGLGRGRAGQSASTGAPPRSVKLTTQ
jgi:hypothetical protein